MLIQFTDTEGHEIWINPIHVVAVRTKTGLLGGKKGAEIWFGWEGDSESVDVPEDPMTVSMKLNAAMPERGWTSDADVEHRKT